MFDLIAGVYRQALRDAQNGKRDAIEWLDMCAPDWRELVDKPKVQKCDSAQRRNGCTHPQGKGMQISASLEA